MVLLRYDVSNQLGVCHACYVSRNRRQVPRTCTEIIIRISEYAFRSFRFVRVNNAQKSFDTRKTFRFRKIPRPKFMNYSPNSFRSYKQCTKTIYWSFFSSRKFLVPHEFSVLELGSLRKQCTKMRVKVFFLLETIRKLVRNLCILRRKEGRKERRKDW